MLKEWFDLCVSAIRSRVSIGDLVLGYSVAVSRSKIDVPSLGFVLHRSLKLLSAEIGRMPKLRPHPDHPALG